MKKRLLVIVFALCSLSMFGQNTFEEIYCKFANEKGANCVNIGSFVMNLGKICMDEKDAEFLKNVDNICVVDVSDCCEDTKNDFRKMANGIQNSGVELIMDVTEDQDHVKIFVKKENDMIKQFIVYSMGEDTCLINIGGNIKMDDVQKLVKYSMR